MKDKYSKVIYETEPIGKEKIILRLTTFDLEAFKRDEALKKIPQKEVAKVFELPQSSIDCNHENIRKEMEKFIVDTYENQLQEMKSYIEFLRDIKIAPIEYSKEEYYIVKEGDTLWDIANRYGTTWEHLAKINRIKNPDLIYPSQRIKLYR